MCKDSTFHIIHLINTPIFHIIRTINTKNFT